MQTGRGEAVEEEDILRWDCHTKERVHLEDTGYWTELTQSRRKGLRSPRHQSTQRMLYLLPLEETDVEFATIATNPDTTHTSAQKKRKEDQKKRTGRRIRNPRARKVAAHHRTHLGRESKWII